MAVAPLPLAPAGVSAQDAARAYRAAEGSGAGDGGGDFGGMIERALKGAVRSGEQAEALAADAVAGEGNLTEVVQAVSRAELTLQTATAIRDRVVQAYQDIMRMPM
jgi:flagellar hook-basal body complex protein FliE